MIILVLNSGSSSLKYQMFESSTEEILAKGLAERISLKEGGKIKHESARGGKSEVVVDMPDHEIAMDHVFRLLTHPENGAIKDISEISAIGHRVVHGGEKFVQSVLVTDEMIKEVDRLSVLAPLHNPPNLKGIRACRRLMPGVPQVAVFDTAFHATMPEHAYIYALPFSYYTEYGVRRYGFHGTSHRFVVEQAQQILEKQGYDPARTRIVTCHLGNGCSMAAIAGGKVVDTTMGMTPAEGLVMGTRSGDIDPAILFYLARELNAGPTDLDSIINKKSGLLGITGSSSDMRDVEQLAAGGNHRAELALSIFCYRVKKYVGSYAAAMGGLDGLVFTGGIGENSCEVRSRVCRDMEFLGLQLCEEKNRTMRGPADISADSARGRILLVPTNEEKMIARETAQVVSQIRIAQAS